MLGTLQSCRNLFPNSEMTDDDKPKMPTAYDLYPLGPKPLHPLEQIALVLFVTLLGLTAFAVAWLIGNLFV